MFEIALFEPNIPPNTGNIIRLCANNGFRLHLIEPLGFDLDEKKLRRAGLDYSEFAEVETHPDLETFLGKMSDRNVYVCTTKGQRYYHEVSYQAGDVLLFGSETHGMREKLDLISENNRLRVPMRPDSRSLNLSNTVALISYEAWRQLDFDGGL